MKKILMLLVAMFTTVNFISAQREIIDITEPQDNWSVSVQTGYSGLLIKPDYLDTRCNSQYIGVGFEKMFTPFFGIEPEISVLIPYTNDDHYHGSNHVLFNAGMNLKFNVTNLVEYNGTRKLFEPVAFVGMGYGNCRNNLLTLRTGFDLNFNIGDDKAWAIVVSPQFVWYDLSAYDLSETTMIELTAGFVYHFETSNGSHSFTKNKYYHEDVVNELNEKINKLRKENNN